MRIRLNFSIEGNAEDNFVNILPIQAKKIVFPVDLHKLSTISDLKMSIEQLLNKRKSCWESENKKVNKFEIDGLFLDNFLLLDEFEIGSVLNNDDELKVFVVKFLEKVKNKRKEVDITSDSESSGSDSIKLLKMVKGKTKKVGKSGNKYKAKQVSKKLTTFHSEDSDSNSESESKSSITNKKPQVSTYQNPDLNIQNENNNYLGNKKDREDLKVGKFNNKTQYTTTNNVRKQNEGKYSNYGNYSKSKNLKTVNPLDKFLKSSESLKSAANIESKFDLIPTSKLEDVAFLNSHFPKLFEKGSLILFRVYELSIETGGPTVSDYKRGNIEEYFAENKSFLIKLNLMESNEKLLEMYGTTSNIGNTEEELSLINVYLKDFIELRIEKSESNITNYTLDNVTTKTNEIEPITAVTPVKQETNNQSSLQLGDKIEMKKDKIKNDSDINKVENAKQIEICDNKTTKKPPTAKVHIFNKIVLPHIKKQVEFYFSDKNYYKDGFLLEKAALDENNFIDIDIIMGFNKIRSMTTNKNDMIEALKDSNMVEFNEEKTKIRKKNIIKE